MMKTIFPFFSRASDDCREATFQTIKDGPSRSRPPPPPEGDIEVTEEVRRNDEGTSSSLFSHLSLSPSQVISTIMIDEFDSSSLSSSGPSPRFQAQGGHLDSADVVSSSSSTSSCSSGRQSASTSSSTRRRAVELERHIAIMQRQLEEAQRAREVAEQAQAVAEAERAEMERRYHHAVLNSAQQKQVEEILRSQGVTNETEHLLYAGSSSHVNPSISRSSSSTTIHAMAKSPSPVRPQMRKFVIAGFVIMTVSIGGVCIYYAYTAAIGASAAAGATAASAGSTALTSSATDAAVLAAIISLFSKPKQV